MVRKYNNIIKIMIQEDNILLCVIDVSRGIHFWCFEWIHMQLFTFVVQWFLFCNRVLCFNTCEKFGLQKMKIQWKLYSKRKYAQICYIFSFIRFDMCTFRICCQKWNIMNIWSRCTHLRGFKSCVFELFCSSKPLILQTDLCSSFTISHQ